MKVKRFLVILITLFFISNMMLGFAVAGDENNPEVNDDTGETQEPGSQFRDIDAAWFGDESNDTVNIYLKLAGSPPGLADLLETQDTTIYEYEVYFDVEGVGYAVCAVIQYAAYIGEGTPIGGVYSITTNWGWELRGVNYASHTDIIQSEATIAEISDSNYHSDNVILEWTVSKTDIGIRNGNEGIGQIIVSTWASVWNADDNPAGSQRDPKTQAWDYAHTHHTNPGKNYPIHGTGNVYYNIILSADATEKITFGGIPVEFFVQAKNNGSDSFTVDFFPGDYDESWEVVLNPNSTTIAIGATRTISVTVTPPKDVENGTVFILRVDGNIHEVDSNGTVPVNPPLYLTVVALTPPDVENEGGWWEDFVEALKENMLIILAVIAVIVVAIIILVVLIRR